MTNKEFLEKLLSATPSGKEFYDKMQNSISVNCPVRKVNYDLEYPSAIVALYLLTNKTSRDKFIDIAKSYKNDIDNDTTLIFFAPQHVIEMGYFIYALMKSLKALYYRYEETKDINFDYNNIAKRWTKLLSMPVNMTEIEQFFLSIDYGIKSRVDEVPENIREEIADILCILVDLAINAIFIPYGKMDEFANDALKWLNDNSSINPNADILTLVVDILNKDEDTLKEV